MTSAFHQAIVLETRGDDRFVCGISDQWLVGMGVNGGYQAGLLAHAAMQVAGDDRRRLVAQARRLGIYVPRIRE